MHKKRPELCGKKNGPIVSLLISFFGRSVLHKHTEPGESLFVTSKTTARADALLQVVLLTHLPGRIETRGILSPLSNVANPRVLSRVSPNPRSLDRLLSILRTFAAATLRPGASRYVHAGGVFLISMESTGFKKTLNRFSSPSQRYRWFLRRDRRGILNCRRGAYMSPVCSHQVLSTDLNRPDFSTPDEFRRFGARTSDQVE